MADASSAGFVAASSRYMATSLEDVSGLEPLPSNGRVSSGESELLTSTSAKMTLRYVRSGAHGQAPPWDSQQ
jgi:hypothetical protein